MNRGMRRNKLSKCMVRGLTACFLLLSLTVSGQSLKVPGDYQGWPGLQTVVEHFADRYSLNTDTDSTTLRFLKMPDGWYVCETSYFRPMIHLKGPVQLWDAQSRTYRSLAGWPPKDRKFDPEQNAGMLFDSLNYKRHPFYGYREWPQDVIRIFEGKEQVLSDELLYGLGRAYGHRAVNLINYSQYRETQGLGLHPFDKDFRVSAMTDEMVSDFLEHKRKAIAIFNQLGDRNPDFETFLGPIGLRAAHEAVSSWLDLSMVGQQQAASDLLRPGLYDDFYVELGKNLLASCDSGAILFTGGDTDTYLSLYVQEVLGYRKDVSVIATSLLNMGRYVNYISQGQMVRFPVSPRLPANSGSTPMPPFYALDWGNYFTLMLDTVLAQLQKQKGEFIDFALSGTTIKGKVFMVRVDRDRVAGLTGANALDLLMALPVKIEENYLLSGQLITLDIINSNDWQRPVYFTYGVAPGNTVGLHRYLWQEGLANRFLPKNPERAFRFGPEQWSIDGKRLTPRLLKALSFKHLPQTYPRSANTLLLLNQYKQAFINAMMAEKEFGRRFDLGKLLKQYEDHFGKVMDVHDLNVISICLAINEEELAKLFLEKVVARIERQLDGEDLMVQPWKVEGALGTLEKYAEKTGSSDLRKRLKALKR